MGLPMEFYQVNLFYSKLDVESKFAVEISKILTSIVISFT